MTMEEREGALVITRLPIEQMGLLTLGLALTGEERQVLEALLAGKKVKVLETGLEYKQYRKTPPLGAYQKFVSLWLGIVIGNVWCTKKVSALTGQTFLLVAPEGHQGPALVCADQAGAGPGDRVLVTRGSGARVAAGESIPVDAAVVGIVDRVEQ